MQAKVLKRLWYFRRSIRRGWREFGHTCWEKAFDSVANLRDGAGSGGGSQESADFGQIGDHLGSFRGVYEEGAQGGGYIGGGEVLLDQFGNDATAGDEVDHGDREVTVCVELSGDLGWVADQPFGELVGQGRNPIDDDKWVSNDGGLHGGGAAGYDAGSGVVQGFAGIGDEVEIGERRR